MNPTPLNFSAHAIETLAQEERNIKQIYGLSERDRNNGVWLSSYYVFLQEILNSSIKFTLPDNGMLVETDLGRPAVYEKERELLKLPFPIVALEYLASDLDDRLVEGNQISTKRIALAVDLDKVSVTVRATMDKLMPALSSITTENNIAIFSLFYLEDTGWSCSLGCAVANKGFVSEDQSTVVKNKGCVPVFAAALLLTSGNPEDFAHLTESARLDTADEAITIVQFCAIMNCQNVDTMKIEAPEKLNRKRLSSGKLPFYEYHILMINPLTSRINKADLGGTHASPRLHLRRGHIRRLSQERVVWVNASVVGNANNGIVDKSYLLKQEIQSKSRFKI